MDDTNLIQKITAPNAGMFTGKGTNSYLIGKKDITLVDPGPNIQSHLENIIEASSGNLKRIFVTHTHTDHSPGADPLAKRLGIPCYGNLVEHDFAMQDRTFKPDKLFTDGYVLETDHRLQREKKVIDAIKKLGKCGLTRLLISVYSDVNPKLLPIAKWSLESHLVKLIDDGVVIRKQNRYSLTEIN